MSEKIKDEFGRLFRGARDAKKLSRASLGLRLGISPKTIQSWEMGRTFIEDLSLIPAIEAELDISLSDLIDRAVMGKRSAGMSESSGPSEQRRRGYAKTGPITPTFEVHVVRENDQSEVEKEAKAGDAFAAIPVIKPTSALRPVAELAARDISHHVIIPREWVPRGGVLVAYRMGDSGMAPMVPLGGIVIVDRRPQEASRSLNRILALHLHKKGLRVRRLVRAQNSDKFFATTIIEGRRSDIPFRPALGDSILGRVVGILAQPE